MSERYDEALRQKFRPEFLNRIDDIIIFNKLDKSETALIAELLIKNLKKRLLALGINLTVTEEAMEFLVSKGYDDEYGARPLKRVIQRHLEDAISERILKGEIKANSTVVVNGDEEGLIFSE